MSSITKFLLRRKLALSLAAAAMVCACADVSVRKIPFAPHYEFNEKAGAGEPGAGATPDWNTMQREADAIPGTRYYLPRPWVSVKEEFPVGGGTWFLWGRVRTSDNGIIALDSVPKELEGRIPSRVPFHRVGVDRGGRTESAPRSDMRAGEGPESGGSTATAAGEPEVVVELRVDPDSILKTVVFTPPAPRTKDEPLKLKVTIDKAKALALVANSVTSWTPTSLYLVPWKSGTPVAEGAIQLKMLVDPLDPNLPSPAGIEVTVLTKDIPAFASVAIGLKVMVDGKEKLVLVHTAGSVVNNPFAGSDKTPATEPAASATDKKAEKKTLSKATVTTSGNPETSPLLKLENKLFDVVLLPDESEQYAIELSAGLGLASASLGLENGWMVEQFTAEIDNRELGQFVTESVTKILDAGISAINPAAAAAGAVAGLPAMTAADLNFSREGPESGSSDEVYVLLQVHHIELAVPGLHPVAKVKELMLAQRRAKTSHRDPSDELLWLAPRVLHRTRSVTTITMVDATRKVGETDLISPSDEEVRSAAATYLGTEPGARLAAAVMQQVVDTGSPWSPSKLIVEFARVIEGGGGMVQDWEIGLRYADPLRERPSDPEAYRGARKALGSALGVHLQGLSSLRGRISARSTWTIVVSGGRAP